MAEAEEEEEEMEEKETKEAASDPELAEILSHMDQNGAGGAAAAAPEVPPPPKPARGRPRRAGRRPAPRPEDGDRIRQEREAELQAKAEKVEKEAAASPPNPAAVPPKSLFEGNRDALTVWPLVLEQALEKNFTADQISIRVVRIPVGPIDLKEVRSKSIDLLPLIGSQVAGDQETSPSEALYAAILEYHLNYNGPAIYQLTFQYRFGRGGNIPGVPANVELRLDPPAVIRRQLEAKEMREAAAGSGNLGPTVLRNPFGGRSFGGGASGVPIAASPNLSAAENKLLQDLLHKTGRYEGLLEAQATAAAAAASAPAPALAPAKDPSAKPAGLTDEEWASIQRSRLAKDMGPAIAQAVTATLVGMGFTPEVVSGLKHIGSAGMGAGAGAGAQLQAIPATQAPVTAMGALKEAISLIREVKGFQSQLGEILPDGSSGTGEEKEEKEKDPFKMESVGVAFPGSETPMSYGPKLEDETWSEYFIRWGTHNPAAMQQIMAKAMQVLDPETIQKVIQSVMARGAKKVGAGGSPVPAGALPEGKPVKGWVPE